MLENVKQCIEDVQGKTFPEFFTKYVEDMQDFIIEKEVQRVANKCGNPSALISGINSIVDSMITK